MCRVPFSLLIICALSTNNGRPLLTFAAPISPGCLAAIFTTAGISPDNAVQYEASFLRLEIPVESVLNPVSDTLLRLSGIASEEDRTAVIACFGDQPDVVKSSTCSSFSSCGSKANCTLESQEYRCQCNDGLHGNSCELDACLENPCRNGGSCVRQSFAPLFACVCLEGFTGTECESEVDHCASAPCQNRAVCDPSRGGFTCRCVVGYKGDLCEKKWLTENYLSAMRQNQSNLQEIVDQDARNLKALQAVITGFESRMSPMELFNEAVTWSQAESRCRRFGGRLAFVRDRHERAMALQAIGIRSGSFVGFWIGGQDVGQNGTWAWLDGEHVLFENWNVNEPNNIGDENCMLILADEHRGRQGMFNNAKCSRQRGYLCAYGH